MRSYRNIGASDYRRWTGAVVKRGEEFEAAGVKEEQAIESEGCLGIRLEELTTAEALQAPVCVEAVPAVSIVPVETDQPKKKATRKTGRSRS